jgi:hypothetical protein
VCVALGQVTGRSGKSLNQKRFTLL